MENCHHCGKAPGEKLFCQYCGHHVPGRTFASISAPPWSASEGHIFNTDKETSIKATDHFLDEREKTIQTSEKWAKWEHGRKQEFQKNKIYAKKKGII